MDINEPLSLILQTVTGWVRGFLAALPNIFVALLLVVLFAVLARITRRVVRRLVGRVSDNLQVRTLLSTVASASVLGIGVFLALGILQLDGVVASLLAGVGIVGLALGFAFQDLAANFMAGVLMTLRRPFRIGEVIETNEFTGTVEAISLRSTRLRSFQGNEIRLPNKYVFENPFVNFSESGDRRVDLACGVAYGDDLEHVRDVAVRSLAGLETLIAGRPVELVYTAFGNSSIDFELRFWIRYRVQRDFFVARSEAIIRLKRAFDEAGITIPFPIRTLDFGVVGGEPLREAWPKERSDSRPEG